MFVYILNILLKMDKNKRNLGLELEPKKLKKINTHKIILY